jgi:sialate O-acetylesterase
VTVGWQKTPRKVVTDNDGNWLVRVPTGKAGGPYTIQVQGKNKLTVNNVLLGEVWLCSGQSNMNFPVSKGKADWMTGRPAPTACLCPRRRR